MGRKEDLEQESDERLVERVRSGVAEAFGVLYDRRWREVYRLLLGKCRGDPHRAENLCQEVFVRALERLVQFRGEASFRSWLFQIAKNAFLDEVRRKVAGELTEETVADRSPGPHQQAETAAVAGGHRAALEACLSALTLKERQLFLLIAELGHPQDQAALTMGVSYEACRQSYSRLRGKLRVCLRERIGEGPA